QRRFPQQAKKGRRERPVDKKTIIILGTGSPIGTRTEPGLVSIATRDLMHIYIIGKSKRGKSRFLCSLLVSLIHSGVGVILIDPAGDLYRLCLKQLIATGFFDLPDAFETLIALDIPQALQHGLYLPFNVLSNTYDPYTNADMVLETFKRIWPALKDGTSPNIETFVKMASFVLAVHHLPLLPCMYYLLTDIAWRDRLLSDIRDELVLSFFRQYDSV